MRRDIMDFFDNPASTYTLIDIPTGSVVASVRAPEALMELLREEGQENPEAIFSLRVVAYSAEGAFVNQELASTILSLA
jgi:hypothetical protein